jgi:hypothetical protein
VSDLNRISVLITKLAMNELIERLAKYKELGYWCCGQAHDALEAQSAEITRLRAVLERTRSVMLVHIDRYIGVRADIIPAPVASMVTLRNEINNVLGAVEEIHD